MCGAVVGMGLIKVSVRDSIEDIEAIDFQRNAVFCYCCDTCERLRDVAHFKILRLHEARKYREWANAEEAAWQKEEEVREYLKNFRGY